MVVWGDVFSKLQFEDTKRSRLVAFISFTISVLIIVLLQISSGSRFLAMSLIPNVELCRDILIVLFGLTFSIFVRILIEIVPRRKWVIQLNSLGTKLAAFSYTLYLTHAPVLRLLEHLGAPKSNSVNLLSISLYVCWLGVGLIVAYMLYYLFERNTPRLKKFLKSHL